MTAASLHIARFKACLELAKRGATPGEREAAEAAAVRIATAAGLELHEAIRIAEGRPARRHSIPRPDPAPVSWPPAYPAPRRRKPKPKSPTVAEALAEKAAELERAKRRAARAEAQQRETYAEQSRWAAAMREGQARRDREWAEQRHKPGTSHIA